jgi:hypothetical protein
MDFKGWWKVLDGERCEPLTVRDAYSRFVLSVLVCRPKTHEVKAELERLFAKYGVPNVIQFDNGPPFVSVQARAGISRLSAWLMSLGIRIVRSRPGCPQDNGGHERMHADMSGDVQSRPGQTVADEQRRLSRWRQEFNHVRPHEALGGKVPADVYKVLERKRPARADYVYPAHMFARPVYTSGALNFMSEELHVGTVFAGCTSAPGIGTSTSGSSKRALRSMTRCSKRPSHQAAEIARCLRRLAPVNSPRKTVHDVLSGSLGGGRRRG